MFKTEFAIVQVIPHSFTHHTARGAQPVMEKELSSHKTLEDAESWFSHFESASTELCRLESLATEQRNAFRVANQNPKSRREFLSVTRLAEMELLEDKLQDAIDYFHSTYGRSSPPDYDDEFRIITRLVWRPESNPVSKNTEN